MMLLLEAKRFAKNAHKGQLRKLSGQDYFSHLDNVALILKHANFSDEVIAAGYLHDVIEDTKVSEEQLFAMFGEEVTRLVLTNTENKILDWESRKGETIEKAKYASLESKAIIAADKLDNSSDLLRAFKHHGDVIWRYFNRGYDKQAWYYHNLVQSLFFGLHKNEIPNFFYDLKNNIGLLFEGYPKNDND
ncbi:hypothetical protein CHH83_05500 [Bacillus sp. 7586-K]|nr:hypothetical protein CHH83_05500 [Bacillus sp. 7586-K]